MDRRRAAENGREGDRLGNGELMRNDGAGTGSVRADADGIIVFSLFFFDEFLYWFAPYPVLPRLSFTIAVVHRSRLASAHHHPPTISLNRRGPHLCCCPHSTLLITNNAGSQDLQPRFHHSQSTNPVILSKQSSSRGSVLGLCLGFAFGGIGVMSVSGSLYSSASAPWPLNRFFALIEVRSMLFGFLLVFAILVLGESFPPKHTSLTV